MKSKIPCEVIRDLIPSYIDDLTSDVTNSTISEHVSECPSCKAVLDSMKEPAGELAENELGDTVPEIDYLKKTKKKNRNIILGVLALAVALVLLAVPVSRMLIPTELNGQYVSCNISVQGQNLTISGVTTDSNTGVSKVDISEDEDGTVHVKIMGVAKSALHDGNINATYAGFTDIKQVVIGDQIVWSDGVSISPITSAVFSTVHPYVGDMPANGKTASVLNMGNYLGAFTNKLDTGSEPYIWNMYLVSDFSGAHVEKMENMMRAYAYVLIAATDNLSGVNYVYTVDDSERNITVMAEDATEFFGEDIKLCGKDIIRMQQLMEKTGLTKMAFSYDSTIETEHLEQLSTVSVVNNIAASDMAAGFAISAIIDGEAKSTQSVVTADGSPMGQGETITACFYPEDFGLEEFDINHELQLEICVIDKNSNQISIDTITIAPEYGMSYRYVISGSQEKGYSITQ